MKFLWMMSVLFCGAMLSAGTDLDVNGEFKGSTIGDKAPKGWTFNPISKYGTGQVVQAGDDLAVKASNTKNDLHYFTSSMFPIAAGEKYEISCDAEGTGKAGVIIYLYDAQNRWISGIYQPAVTLKPGKNELKWTYTIPAELQKKTPVLARFAFRINGPGEVTFSDFEVEKEDNK